jgi:predicted nucleic acid-binding protein
MILVDTSVLIDLFKGDENKAVRCFRDIIQQQIPFGITSVIYQEVLQGANTKKEYALLDKYLRCQHFLHPKDLIKTYAHAAQIYFMCRKKGVTVRSTIDCLIACIAIESDFFLLHHDKDFLHMASVADLKLYDH